VSEALEEIDIAIDKFPRAGGEFEVESCYLVCGKKGIVLSIRRS